MKLIVCIKQVPNTVEVKLDPATGRLIRDGVPNIINPDDKNALEEALRIKDENPGTTVTVLSMGPAQADVAMREALAMGADEAILLSDRAFGGSDTWATSYIIATAIKKINDFDIIFCGRQAIDGDTAQVGPQIAEQLNIPQITYVEELTVSGDKVTARRKLEEGYSVVEAKMPVLITAIKELNTPRYMTPAGIFDAYKKYIETNSKYSARVVKYNTNTSTYFPLITLVQSNNYDLDNNSNKNLDYFEAFYFTINIYTKDKKSGAKTIAAQIIDKELETLTVQFFKKLNMKRTLDTPTPNLDTEVFRRTIQYQCELSNRGNIIRR